MEEEDNLDLSEEELITAQKVLQNLENAWINEKFAPEILPHQCEMLELMLGQITHMEENLISLDKNDIRYIIHKMELERIRYIIASYLRCRLQKIEKFTEHILREEGERILEEKRLSQEEQKFAEEYLSHRQKYFHQIALQHIPSLQSSETDQEIVKPNLTSHVFIKAKVSVPAVVVGVDDDEVDLTEGSQHIIPYNLVSDLILKGSVQLI